MKRIILSILFLIGLSTSALPQLIESFDTDLSADTTYQFSLESGSRMDYLLNTTDFVQGTGSGEIKFVIGAIHEWGSFGQLIKRLPAEQYYDWSATDSLSLMIKVVTPPTIPVNMVFRIHIADRPTPDAPIEEWVYEHATILDATSEWVELKVPIKILSTDGSATPSDSGFVIFPSSWGGGPGNSWNNNEFDWDKIIGFNLGAITSGYTPGTNIPADSLTVRFDNFRRYGNRSVPAIVFNGIQFMGNLSVFTWGQSNLEVVPNAGPTPNSNAIKWTQGNEWGTGWTGMGLNVSPVFNLASSWQVDSVKFKIKCPPGTGALRVQFEAGSGKKGTIFTPTADDQWHNYAFPLRDMVFQEGTFFDSSQVTVVGMMAEASAVAGTVIWITDWWTGNPKFDVIAPEPPTGVAAFAGTFQNVVTWVDVPGETGEVYDIFYSKNPITDVTLPGVEVVKLNVAEGGQLMEHLLLAPNTDQPVTYYYAVVCKDVAGNKSLLSQNSSAVTNTAKGRPTVSLSAPTNFVADGNLAEWQAINPFRMFLSDGTGHLVTNTTISGDADCSAKAYIAMDNQYMYIAFDVDDDIVVPDAQNDSYLNDCPDLYIGLYDYRGMPHVSYQRGAQPDYHFRFAYNRVIIDGSAGTDSLIGEGVNYYWEEKFPSGYIVECRINLSELALHGNDLTFVPREGTRLPIDFALNDADATNSREGIMTYSPYNEDKSYQDVSRWIHTFIGNLWEPATGINDEILTPDNYGLAQNYPNPFNPSTTIKYAIEKSGFVSLKVYDVLGREVADLVAQDQTAGVYTVQFDASLLSSGIYFYKLESGSFSKINKMMLVK